MNTASIFSFISELQTLNHSELSGKEYLRYLNDLELGFKACLFQCTAENREFSDITAIVSNELYESYKLNLGRERMITTFPTKGEDSKATIDLLRLVQKKSLDASRYVEDYYKAKNCSSIHSNKSAIRQKSIEHVLPIDSEKDNSSSCIQEQNSLATTPYNINQRYVYHSFKEVCAAFPSLKLHKVRDRAWRKANNFPDGQDCRGGKCTFYHQQVADWVAENN